MQSGVVLLLRICGNVFAVERVNGVLRYLHVGTYSVRPPDQGAAIKLLRGR